MAQVGAAKKVVVPRCGGATQILSDHLNVWKWGQRRE